MIFEQLNTFNALALQKGKQPLPDVRSPYFARIVLKEKLNPEMCLLVMELWLARRTKDPL